MRGKKHRMMPKNERFAAIIDIKNKGSLYGAFFHEGSSLRDPMNLVGQARLLI